MIKVIGKENCPKCYITKKRLTDNEINFQYIDFEKDLNEKEQNEYISIARKQGQMALPLLFKNNTLVKTEDIL
ncbi:TPA: glutaredoxin domain-containing protein [Clostridium botulinum]|uniref:glutaredoxin domain-containing protein n=1 Tax=Clostridium botulinum TaxID=1491 RepID=UPI0004673ACC|nr:glutaredoxin domain-containing protein [Clostridium botulinum]APR02470.1 glutaredoxin family protein [Clostridium botulinum]AUN01528.1 hypothetical protein RSJ19_00665 [Clostridium botulinum]MBN3359244.1 NrdH-redoxin [Clostridium botulinum]QDY27093.1 NrdH-redoxin [Clostridium botulinum]